MTDDERAFKYALERKKNLHLSQRDTNLTCLAYLHGLKDGKPKWHDLRKNPGDLPNVDRLVRVRLMNEMEYICETCYYEPSEDEIGYGKLILSFYELNGEWIDDNEIIAWCEIPKFEETEDDWENSSKC